MGDNLLVSITNKKVHIQVCADAIAILVLRIQSNTHIIGRPAKPQVENIHV